MARNAANARRKDCQAKNRLRTTVSGLAKAGYAVIKVCPLLPNPCYKLAAVIYRKTQIEALNKRIKKKKGWQKKI